MEWNKYELWIPCPMLLSWPNDFYWWLCMCCCCCCISFFFFLSSFFSFSTKTKEPETTVDWFFCGKMNKMSPFTWWGDTFVFISSSRFFLLYYCIKRTSWTQLLVNIFFTWCFCGSTFAWRIFTLVFTHTQSQSQSQSCHVHSKSKLICVPFLPN